MRRLMVLLSVWLVAATAGAREPVAYRLEVRIAADEAPKGTPSAPVMEVTLGGDGGGAKLETRVGDRAYSIGARIDPVHAAANITELQVWCTRDGAKGPVVELSVVTRRALVLDQPTVVAKRSSGGVVTVVTATLRAL